jgi:hypothetical protein
MADPLPHVYSHEGKKQIDRAEDQDPIVQYLYILFVLLPTTEYRIQNRILERVL